jgi:DUF971 family protein
MPHPTQINLKTQSRVLSIRYDDGNEFDLDCEYLRVYSPSAEVKGHGPGQSVLQVGKQHVNIMEIVPVGNYAIRLVFDDRHDSGIYTWEYLYRLGRDHDQLWEQYLQALEAAGQRREPVSDERK